ncbi:hypothetical protein [Sphingorhabdus sp. SMR4y]|uniref:hypothetical protein n=1 Tax=Sphingorhabdus sp. SMR4y TaxID=2584094 RepID=UPI000B60E0BC|nr:hypothetical protein [Sphingorhabdus sp. SMR4y]ASK87005.1 hypothetical protein SPHFLASMR4Y_00213 [Sphingorhabdus sp. SMR4y]
MAKRKHIVVLEADTFGLDVNVSVQPAPVGERLDRSFELYQIARQYAEGLTRHNGWVLIDRLGCEPVMAG